LALSPFLAALGLKFYTQVFPGPYRLLAHYAEQIPLARQLAEYERQLFALQVEPDCLPEKPYAVTKDGFQRTKPHVNVYLMGLSHLDKLALLSAISRVMCGKGLAEYVAIDEMIKHKSELNLGLIDYTGYVEFESTLRHYAQAFGYGPIYDVKNLILFMTAVDGAILLVSTATGITPELRNLIRISRQCDIDHILVYIDRSIKDLDAQQLDDLTSDTKNLLQENGYGDRSPIITGSAFKALNGEASAMGMDSIVKLVEAMDAHIPEQMMRGHEQPFMMPVEDVFIISGRGLAASGRIKFGRIRVGEEIEIIGFAPPSRAVVSGIQMFRKLLDEGQAGDNIVIIFEDLTRDDIFRGQMLVQPGSMQAVRQFEALVYMMNKDEGGRLIRPAKGFRPQFYFWTTDVTGIVTPPEGVHEFSPGTVYTISVKLIDPVAMNKDTRFAIRVGGRTVGTGKVTNLIMLK
jgi:elongation factor Tu